MLTAKRIEEALRFGKEIKDEIKYYVLDTDIYKSTEEINEEYIGMYDLLDDDITDFITDEEMEAVEMTGEEIKKLEELPRMNLTW